jgi:hypothetical protein
MTILITEVECMKNRKGVWSVNYMVREAKETVRAQGIPSTPHHEPDEMLEVDIIRLVLQLVVVVVVVVIVMNTER